MKSLPIDAQDNTKVAPTLVRLDKAAVAEKLGIGARTLDKLVAEGRFPPGVRFGRFLYWSEQVVLKWQGTLFEAQMAWHPGST